MVPRFHRGEVVVEDQNTLLHLTLSIVRSHHICWVFFDVSIITHATHLNPMTVDTKVWPNIIVISIDKAIRTIVVY